MKLIDQDSDKVWRLASSFDGPVYVRGHDLHLREALDEMRLDAFCRLLQRPSASDFGGVRATYLLFDGWHMERKGDHWDVRVRLLESTIPWVPPFRVRNTATGEVGEIDANLYGDPVEFRDVLPTCKPFPAAEIPA